MLKTIGTIDFVPIVLFFHTNSEQEINIIFPTDGIIAKIPSFGKGERCLFFFAKKKKGRKRSWQACRLSAVEFGSTVSKARWSLRGSPRYSRNYPLAETGGTVSDATRFFVRLGAYGIFTLSQGASSGLRRFPPSYLAPNGLLRL